MIATTGEGKSAVATPDGKSRKKKKKNASLLKMLCKLNIIPIIKVYYVFLIILCFPDNVVNPSLSTFPHTSNDCS